MKLKINNQYYTDESGNVVEFDEAVKYTDSIKLISNGMVIATFGGISNMSLFVLEGGEFTIGKTWKELYEEQKVINDEQDELIAELIEQ